MLKSHSTTDVLEGTPHKSIGGLDQVISSQNELTGSQNRTKEASDLMSEPHQSRSRGRILGKGEWD